MFSQDKDTSLANQTDEKSQPEEKLGDDIEDGASPTKKKFGFKSTESSSGDSDSKPKSSGFSFKSKSKGTDDSKDADSNESKDEGAKKKGFFSSSSNLSGGKTEAKIVKYVCSII